MSYIKQDEIALDTGNIIITLHKQGELWKLEWSDGIANTWAELYPVMSVALVRMATLVAIGEDLGKGDLFFTETPDKFTEIASDFLFERIS